MKPAVSCEKEVSLLILFQLRILEKGLQNVMRQLLRIEHWIIQKFRFDRMSNNVFWLVVLLCPFILGLMFWILRLHQQPDIEFIISRDPSFSGEVADIYYKDDSFYLRPLIKNLLINFKPITKTTEIRVNDQIVIGHTIFQVRQLDGWTPHLRTIGYYATDKDLNDGISVGRSIHAEELNNWNVNEIIVKDSTVEPVHMMIFPLQKQQYRIKSVGKKGVYVPYVPAKDEKQTEETPTWSHITTETTIQAEQQIKLGGSVFQFVYIEAQEALALKIIRGVRPTYKLSREAHNIIGGLRMIPKEHIPDYLIDEEFLEYVRQTIEENLFYLDDPKTRQETPKIYVKGFDTSGKLVQSEFNKLSEKEKALLHKIFRFREQAGIALRWRRPFNREKDDSYKFYPDQTEFFIIDEKTNQIKNIYQYAARLTNPHTIAEEIATQRGEIYDRDQKSHARLFAYVDPKSSPVSELLLVPSQNPDTVIAFSTKKESDNVIYVAGGYRFSDGTSVVNEAGNVVLISGNQKTPLQDGQQFTTGQYTFRYAAQGKGLLAQNLGNGKRYYPLGSRLAHIIGYSFAKSQFKGNVEKVFDNVLLGQEKQQPWWSLERTTERTPGNNLILTIDDDLQRVVYAELSKKLSALNKRYKTPTFRGAAIVIDKEGAILASATIPSYNPNDMRSILQALKESSEDHWNSSYINRATQKSYPPGSTMKVIMSTLVLDNKDKFLWDLGDGQYKIRNGNGSFVSTGRLTSFQGISLGRYSVPNFGGKALGELTLDQALTYSDNSAFSFLALSAGWKTIQHYAELYGFNQQFDFLPYEMFKDDISLVSSVNRELRDPLTSLKSQVPTPKTRLKLPQLARMGIGQWEILATPLQMATVAMTVGNFGLRPYPHIVKGLEDLADHSVQTFPYPQKKQVFPANIFSKLQPMMQHVVQKGSGVRMTRSTIPYYSLKDHVAGKTGTAEVEDQRGRKYNVVWFISFAPVENPQMAIAVVIEKGPLVSGESVEVARGVWEKAILLFPELFQVKQTAQSVN